MHKLLVNFIIISIGVNLMTKAALFFEDNIMHQIHSNNDLRELRQNLLKGSRRFKFDLYYIVNHSSCGPHPSCFLLNHDTPLPVVPYNTSDQLLTFLSSAEFYEISLRDYVSIALCFKSAPDKCSASSAKFQDWLSLIDAFHASALSVLPTR